MKSWLAVCGALLLASCGDNDDVFVQPVAQALCYWRHPEGCEPCSDRRDYGPDNTCEDVVWRGRSETDFCLQTYPCDYTPPPVTRIPD